MQTKPPNNFSQLLKTCLLMVWLWTGVTTGELKKVDDIWFLPATSVKSGERSRHVNNDLYYMNDILCDMLKLYQFSERQWVCGRQYDRCA